MKLLDAVNISLRAATQGSVNDLEEGDSKAAQARNVVERTRKEILKNGYHVNTNQVDLAQDVTGRVPLSSTWFRVTLPRAKHLSWRWDGDTKYVWDPRENEWYTDTPIEGALVVFDIEDFSQIDETLATWIAWEAATLYFSEVHASDPPMWVMKRRDEMQAAALNSLIKINFNSTTGWGYARTLPRGRVLVNIDMEWVAL